MNIDDRLRAAGSALREGSANQVDAAGRLREILRHAERVPQEPAVELVPAPVRPSASLLRRAQRLALAVNLLLVLALGVALVVVVDRGQDLDSPPAPVPPERTAAVVPTSTVVQNRTITSVPEACIDTTELADEVISRLNRNVRDERLFLALRDYTIASQACRREASP
jgi:hypothetical protein